MKVATLTFHWASNYGAIIQAYALQQYLKRQGLQTEIIDYVPRRVVVQQFVLRLRRRAFVEFARERSMRAFRSRHLVVSDKRYPSRASLENTAVEYDAVICGSDQIWNEWFTLNAEGGTTRSYLLDFVPPGVKRISYAASFGTETLSDAMATVVGPELAKFDALSVREDSGSRILAGLDLTAQVVVDPTLLLTRDAYDTLIGEHSPARHYSFFPYILHSGQDGAHRVKDHIATTHYSGEPVFQMDPVPLLDWLHHLQNADFVVTNSFHGMVFALMFERQFLVVPVEGAGESMNGRFTTLLNAVGLESRYLQSTDATEVDRLFSEPIDWVPVRAAIATMRQASATFLQRALASGQPANETPAP